MPCILLHKAENIRSTVSRQVRELKRQKCLKFNVENPTSSSLGDQNANADETDAGDKKPGAWPDSAR